MKEFRTSKFAVWLFQLNQRMEKERGISIYDLPDYDYFEAYEEEQLTVSQMFNRLITEFWRNES